MSASRRKQHSVRDVGTQIERVSLFHDVVVLVIEEPKVQRPLEDHKELLGIVAKEATRILFDVPEGGYATTNVPITCATWNDYGKTKIEFTGLEELVGSLKSKVVMPLVQVTNETFSAKFKTSVEAAKKLLPPKCSLSYSEDNDLLRLTVRPGIGGMLLVR